jgi:VIT1/CCC1 family predicted Fe2+/Mn2+ transporter
MLNEDIRRKIINFQKNEITEHFIYRKLSESVKNLRNKKILESVSNYELKHYNFWKKYTGEDLKPNRLKIWKYFLISRIFGATFGLKLMEKGEEGAQIEYEKISTAIPDAKTIMNEEGGHEKQLIDLIDEEKLRYIGSIILGLNDALVELTGALAGFTLALQNTRLIAMAGLITGIAGSLSMATSEYLSTKSEESVKSPSKSSFYTGLAYVLTVLVLISPYLIFADIYFSLVLTILTVIIVILIFTYYVSIAKDIPFRKRFSEMVLISLGVATLTFIIGFLVRVFLKIEI